jgi:crotonobetainyl-CoA:carnitine CoA-transferase CaiB-like acyl-CoA transferase
VRFDGKRADAEFPPPGLGEHTAEIVASLGIGGADVDRLKSEGVLG